MILKTVSVNEIVQYENNPRVINDNAVDAVMHSIKECGYIAPIVVDENMVILAGHTRFLALKKMQQEEVQVEVVSGITEEQKRKYRLLDNKTNELSTWDFDALKEESEGLDFSFDFKLDDLFVKGENEKIEKQKQTKEKSTSKICTCPRCGKQWEE